MPWGRLGPGESPSAAALRETREEAGIVAEVHGLLGIQELPPPWQGQIGIVYLCRHHEGEPEPDHHETDAARYLTHGEIGSLTDPVEPLSHWLATRVLRGEFTVIQADDRNPFRPSVGYL